MAIELYIGLLMAGEAVLLFLIYELIKLLREFLTALWVILKDEYKS